MRQQTRIVCVILSTFETNINLHFLTLYRTVLCLVGVSMQTIENKGSDFLCLPDNVGVIKALKLLEEGDLSEDGHRDAVLGQGEAHLLEGHDVAGQPVAGLEHRAVGSWKILEDLCNQICKIASSVGKNEWDSLSPKKFEGAHYIITSWQATDCRFFGLREQFPSSFLFWIVGQSSTYHHHNHKNALSPPRTTLISLTACQKSARLVVVVVGLSQSCSFSQNASLLLLLSQSPEGPSETRVLRNK